jgi:uncharacterized membrane protein YphA (DoxX/SURF4 family)
MKAPFLIGRLLFGGFFLYNGINHLRNRKAMAPYAQAKGVPAAETAVTLSAIPLLIGGTSILLGVKPKIGAAAIVAFLAAVSPMMHDFWRAEDPNQRTSDMTNFMKNMALLGAALALMNVKEPWEASVPVGRPRPRILDKVRSISERIAA